MIDLKTKLPAIYGAIYDGADVVMLSAESATGAYPVETVEMMSRIIEKTERHKHYRLIVEATELEVAQSPPHAVPSATAGVAAALKAPAIVAYTASGTTASRISRARLSSGRNGANCRMTASGPPNAIAIRPGLHRPPLNQRRALYLAST